MGVKMCVFGFSAVLGVAALLLTPQTAGAKPGGAKWGAPGLSKGKSFIKPHAGPHRGAHRRAPFHGLVAGFAPDDYAASYLRVTGDAPSSGRHYLYLPTPQNLNCQRSRETVSVPSEYGGEQTISVTRC